MDKYKQLKKVVNKFRNIKENDSTKSEDTCKKVKLPKRAFSFFKSATNHDKLSNISNRRLSVDVAKLQRSKINDDIQSCHSSISSIISDTTKEDCNIPYYLNYDQDVNISKPNIKPFYPDSHLNITTHAVTIKNESHMIYAESFLNSFQNSLMTLFTYPNNFYICLSYVVTIFLVISTIFLSQKVYRLEIFILDQLKKSEICENLYKLSNYERPKGVKATQEQLMIQFGEMFQIMKNIQERIS